MCIPAKSVMQVHSEQAAGNGTSVSTPVSHSATTKTVQSLCDLPSCYQALCTIVTKHGGPVLLSQIQSLLRTYGYANFDECTEHLGEAKASFKKKTKGGKMSTKMHHRINGLICYRDNRMAQMLPTLEMFTSDQHHDRMLRCIPAASAMQVHSEQAAEDDDAEDDVTSVCTSVSTSASTSVSRSDTPRWADLVDEDDDDDDDDSVLGPWRT